MLPNIQEIFYLNSVVVRDCQKLHSFRSDPVGKIAGKMKNARDNVYSAEGGRGIREHVVKKKSFGLVLHV